MKKISFLLIAVIFACAACRQTSTTNSNIQSNSAANHQNSTPAANILSNANRTSQNNAETDPELLKQIEAQQLETADPRKAANKSSEGNGNQSPSPKTTTGSSQRQTW